MATAGAQIMRYWQYPTASVAAKTFTCAVGGTSAAYTMMGGIYDWSAMSLVPADGVTEAQNKGQELLGDEALEELLRRHTGAGTANLIDEVIKAIRAFADGAEQADDITMLTFRVTPDNN